MKNKNIQIIRILATLMIFICHIANIYNHDAVAQMFSSAVFIFLVITGYLYGSKKIKNKKKWLIKKVVQVQKPVFIWIVAIICFCLICKTAFNIGVVPIYIFAFQGFLKGFIDIDFGFQALAHLWYLSFALLGYLIISMANGTEFEKKIKNNVSKTAIVTFVLLLLLSVFNIGLGVKFAYIATLMLAYFYSDKLHKITPVMSIILALAAIVVRFLFKNICDNTFVYDEVVYSITQAMIALSIFCLILSLKLQINKYTKVIDFLDSNTYAFYITHYIFMIAIPHINPVLNITFITCLSIVSSLVLRTSMNIVTGARHEK